MNNDHRSSREKFPKQRDEYLLVDGYNIIFAWEHLKRMADVSLDDARTMLLDTLCDYQGYRQINVIVVFDAHKVSKGVGVQKEYFNISVVFTREAETADNYIEKTVGRLSGSYKVRVATSDNLEQIIILGKGAVRVSASELQTEITETKKQMNEKFILNKPIKSNLLLDRLDKKTAGILEMMRRQK